MLAQHRRISSSLKALSKNSSLLFTLSYLLLSNTAHATNGYFQHGYGIKSQGRAGTSITAIDDAFGGANNPATMAFGKTRIDFGVNYFSPDRSAARTDSALAASVKSENTQFYIPEFGYNVLIENKGAVGLTIYGNGGMNTSYPSGQINCGSGAANILCGSTELGVDLQQLILAPYLAYKVSDKTSIGVSPLIAYQTFEAKGLQAFMPMSNSSTNLTNNGKDSSTGWGFKVGLFSQLSDSFSFGAYYASRIFMKEFSKYKGLFAENGDFDIPSNYGVGMGYKVTDHFNLSFDIESILYSEVASVGNSPKITGLPANLLGKPEGMGFGWSDMQVFKLGTEYTMSDSISLRGGVNYGKMPIDKDGIGLAILAPATPELHLSLGATYNVNESSEVTAQVTHALEAKLSAPDPVGFGGTDTVKMSQNSFGVSYSKRF